MTTITPSQEQQVVDQVPKQLYIGGEWRDGAKGTLSVEDPSTGESLCEVADASVDDAKAALDAAVAAGPEFARMAPRERGEILRRAFEMIIERQEELALLMTLEMGKTVKESEAEISYASEFFRWFAEEAVNMFSTPPGRPACSRIFPNASIDSGVCWAGLTTIVQPAAIAGPILRVPIAVGKFQGVTNTQGPTGWRIVRMRPLPVVLTM